MSIMRAGRSRWKIENETFNTLKNQNYRFEHNRAAFRYGHGKESLSSVFAHLMLLAFLNDQIIQRWSGNFKILWVATKTKTKLWEMIRSLFRVKKYKKFKELYVDLTRFFKLECSEITIVEIAAKFTKHSTATLRKFWNKLF